MTARWVYFTMNHQVLRTYRRCLLKESAVNTAAPLPLNEFTHISNVYTHISFSFYTTLCWGITLHSTPPAAYRAANNKRGSVCDQTSCFQGKSNAPLVMLKEVACFLLTEFYLQTPEGRAERPGLYQPALQKSLFWSFKMASFIINTAVFSYTEKISSCVCVTSLSWGWGEDFR